MRRLDAAVAWQDRLVRALGVFVVVVAIVAIVGVGVTRGQNSAEPTLYWLVFSPQRGQERSIEIGPGHVRLDLAPDLQCSVAPERDMRHASLAIYVTRTVFCRGALTGGVLRVTSVACCDDPECEPRQRTASAPLAIAGGVSPVHLTLQCASAARLRRRPWVPPPTTLVEPSWLTPIAP